MRSLQYWHLSSMSYVPDEWQQADVSPVLKKVKNMLLTLDRFRSHASAAEP